MNKLKKLICILVIVVTLGLCITGCGRKEQIEDMLPDNFEVVEVVKDGYNYCSVIVYDKNTKVEYLIIKLGYGKGITPLLDSDGKPLLYEG